MKAVLSVLTPVLSAAGRSTPFGTNSSSFHSLFQKSTEIVVCYTSVEIFQCGLPAPQVSCTIHFLIARFLCSLNKLLEFQNTAVITGIF